MFLFNFKKYLKKQNLIEKKKTNNNLFFLKKKITFQKKNYFYNNIISNIFFKKKFKFRYNNYTNILKYLQKNLKGLPFKNKHYKNTKKFIIKILIFLILTHDLNFFLKKISKLFQNTSRFFILRVILKLKFLNTKIFKEQLNLYNISGLYIKISGKLGGKGGSKKIRKYIIFGKPNLSNYNFKLIRSQKDIWSYSGKTNISVYMTTK